MPMDPTPESDFAKAVSLGGALLGNILAWLHSATTGRIDYGATATGITGIGLAVAGTIYTVAVSRAKAKREAERLELEAEMAARHARLEIEADAASAKLKIEEAAEHARIAMMIERDQKLAPLLKTQMAELNRRLAEAEQGREDLRLLLTSIRNSQVEIKEKMTLKPRVLIVDDDADTGALFRRALEAKGYDCAVAGTLSEARAQLGPRTSWVVLDHVLPDGGGLDLLREIRAASMPCKVAFVTGVDSASTLEAADAAMADIIMSKPIDPEKLVAQMRSLAGKSPRPHASDVDIAQIRSVSDSGIIPIPKP